MDFVFNVTSIVTSLGLFFIYLTSVIHSRVELASSRRSNQRMESTVVGISQCILAEFPLGIFSCSFDFENLGSFPALDIQVFADLIITDADKIHCMAVPALSVPLPLPWLKAGEKTTFPQGILLGEKQSFFCGGEMTPDKNCVSICREHTDSQKVRADCITVRIGSYYRNGRGAYFSTTLDVFIPIEDFKMSHFSNLYPVHFAASTLNRREYAEARSVRAKRISQLQTETV